MNHLPIKDLDIPESQKRGIIHLHISPGTTTLDELHANPRFRELIKKPILGVLSVAPCQDDQG